MPETAALTLDDPRILFFNRRDNSEEFIAPSFAIRTTVDGVLIAAHDFPQFVRYVRHLDG